MQDSSIRLFFRPHASRLNLHLVAPSGLEPRKLAVSGCNCPSREHLVMWALSVQCRARTGSGGKRHVTVQEKMEFLVFSKTLTKVVAVIREA